MPEEVRPEWEDERPRATAPETMPIKKKPKKTRGRNFFLLLLLGLGVAMGLHFSGIWDARPMFWGAVPRIPYIGGPLAGFFEIPERYTLTVAERRTLELEEWQKRLDDRERSLGGRIEELDALSDDLNARNRLLDRQAANMNRPGAASQPTPDERQRQLVDQVAKTYQEISPRNAAQIVEQLREDLAVELLRKLPIDARAAILGKMTPQKAARITDLMSREQER